MKTYKFYLTQQNTQTSKRKARRYRKANWRLQDIRNAERQPQFEKHSSDAYDYNYWINNLAYASDFPDFNYRLRLARSRPRAQGLI